MRLFTKAKDGGPKSPVDAYFLFEIKNIATIALLKFNEGGRESYHTHAFNACSWFICGELEEDNYKGEKYTYSRSLSPKFTPRSQNHRVKARRNSWVFTVRGPWAKRWSETNEQSGVQTVFGHGRKILSQRTI